jgi:phosphotransferase system IIA component
MQRCTLEKLGGRRPIQCQVRQSQNATHADNRKTDVDWLIHIGVDEFIVSQA